MRKPKKLELTIEYLFDRVWVELKKAHKGGKDVEISKRR